MRHSLSRIFQLNCRRFASVEKDYPYKYYMFMMLQVQASSHRFPSKAKAETKPSTWEDSTHVEK
ncbi:unnamed protein product [Prunus brigantina]